MPVLEPRHTIKQFYLPSTALKEDNTPAPLEDQAWVKMDVGPITTQDVVDANPADTNSSARMARMLASRIKEWNFTDTNGVAIPVTFDNILLMDSRDFMYLTSQDTVNTVQSLEEAEKKASSSISTPSETTA